MRKIISIVFVLSFICATVIIYARISAEKNAFIQAEDFPREALIYVQIRDLPALIKLWSESDLRRKYLESANFGEFKNRHLALKLAERSHEIYEQIGVLPNLGFASTLSAGGAALAVYDIGKMEMVFVAPMSEEKILASALFLVEQNFEQIQLDDETVVYQKEIEVDRARQRQKVFFANFRGRLILATSEKYFLQTLDNIKGKTPKNRLSGEPDFRWLAEKTKPNMAMVWLNQQKLNDDWYFKHYWLMSDVESLKNLRAGMFDFEMQENKFVERRVFLTVKNEAAAKIKAETANRLAALIPENAPFYQIETAENDFDESVLNVLFDLNNETTETAQDDKDYHFYGWEKSYSYSNLDRDFSKQINEAADEFSTETAEPRDQLSKIIGAANPDGSVKLFSPKSLPSPLFFDNRKAMIFSLRNPRNLDRSDLEAAISNAARKLLTINNQKDDFVWNDFQVDKFSARVLMLPSLGWKIFYAVRRDQLFFSGSEDLFKEILAAGDKKPELEEDFEQLTVIDLKNRTDVFDGVFETLEADNRNAGNFDSDFFTGNIGSLFDVVSDVEKIEIRRTSAQNFLFEEINFVLKKKAE